MPIRVPAHGPAPGPGRIPVPGQAGAGVGRKRILGPVAARRARSGRAPTPGSGHGRCLTARRRRGAGRAPTAWHGPVYAIPVRRRPGLHGPQERNGRAANPVPAGGRPTGTAETDRSVRRTSQGRAAGAPGRALTRGTTRGQPIQAHPCPARPAGGAVAATVPAPARMRAARRKRCRGMRAPAAVAAPGPSRPHRTVRLRWAVMSRWTARRPRTAIWRPDGARPRAVARRRPRPGRRARTRHRGVADCAAGTRRRDATGPTLARARAGPLGGAAPPDGTRRRPGRRTSASRRHATSGSTTVPGPPGQERAAGPPISTALTWSRRTTGPVPGLPGPAPGPAGGGSVPCCWPCWRSSSSWPVRWPR